MPTKITCFVHHRNGAGKTATAELLAHSLSQKGGRMPPIDLAPQARCAATFQRKPVSEHTVKFQGGSR